MVRRPALALIAAPAWVLGAVGDRQAMGPPAPGTPPPPAKAAAEQADFFRVDKGARRLELQRDDALIRSDRIVPGGTPDAHTRFAGNQRTPEGGDAPDWRAPRPVALPSLRIRCPDAADRACAAAAGRNPGGPVMIHGLSNGRGLPGAIHHWRGRTDDGIAVTQVDMREIWSLVPNGTQLEILP